MRVALLGATGHIARNLICSFAAKTDVELLLFSRSPDVVEAFLQVQRIDNHPQIRQSDSFGSSKYDAVINCIGVSDPQKQKEAGLALFHLTEQTDERILAYLDLHPDCVYIAFSSGAIYGTAFDAPVDEQTKSEILVNPICPADFYRIVKINAEAKHRCASGFGIVDLRVFSFFSRHLDVNGTFLLAELIRCVRQGTVFKTSRNNIIRDYVHPDDLFSLVSLILSTKRINCAFDVYSLAPIDKLELVNLFQREYGLHVDYTDENYTTVTGAKVAYFSTNHSASKIGYFPHHDSRGCILQESRVILGRANVV